MMVLTSMQHRSRVRLEFSEVGHGSAFSSNDVPKPSKVPWERLAPAIESLVKAARLSRDCGSRMGALTFLPLGFGMFLFQGSGGL